MMIPYFPTLNVGSSANQYPQPPKVDRDNMPSALLFDEIINEME